MNWRSSKYQFLLSTVKTVKSQVKMCTNVTSYHTQKKKKTCKLKRKITIFFTSPKKPSVSVTFKQKTADIKKNK